MNYIFKKKAIVIVINKIEKNDIKTHKSFYLIIWNIKFDLFFQMIFNFLKEECFFFFSVIKK